MRKSFYVFCAVLTIVATSTPLILSHSAAQTAPTASAIDAVSDASAALTVGQTLNWTHTPVGSPTLATVSCGVHQTGVTLAVAYGKLTMKTGATNQQSNQFVGVFYLNTPQTGTRTVAVTLTASGGPANVQCSATTWTGTKGVDLSIASTSQDLSGSATSLTLAPTAAVPANEFFFGAIHRYMPQGSPNLTVAGQGASASIVDSNVGMGNGTGFGCQAVTFAPWEDCIGTAQLATGGLSMTFSWASFGYATGAGFGIKTATRAVAPAFTSSDATGSLTVNQTLTWNVRTSGSPPLATVSCAVHQTGVILAVSYGGAGMTTAITNQQSNQYVGLFYLNNPPSGARSVAVTLSASGGLADVQCSATVWTGVTGVDTTIANASSDLSGVATSLSLAPTSAVPANEFFLGVIHRYMPQGAPALTVSGSGATASIVDSNTNMGTGSGFGCQAVTFAPWEDCIGSAQLGAGGVSMTFSWTTFGYAVAVGIGIKTS